VAASLTEKVTTRQKDLEDIPRALFQRKIKDQYQSRARDIERDIERLKTFFASLPNFLTKLGIERKPDEITTEEIRLALEQKKKELWAQRTAGKTPISIAELRTKALELPIVAYDVKTKKYYLKEPDLNIGAKSEIQYLAYGGTSYNEITRSANWGVSIQEGLLGDRYGLYGKQHEPVFGTGQESGRRFVILRELVNRESRGGYAYSFLFDPGEDVWQKADWNGALIVRNIYDDPVLRHFLVDSLWKFRENIPGQKEMKDFFARLLQTNWQIDPVDNSELAELWQEAEINTTPMNMPGSIVSSKKSVRERLSPAQVAQALAAIPADKRKMITFLFGGGLNQASGFGSKIVWDWTL